MKIEAKMLGRLLAHAKRVVDPKSTMPALRCVRLTGSSQTLSLEATDLLTSLQLEAPVDGSLEASVVVSLKKLTSVLDAKTIKKVGSVRLRVDCKSGSSDVQEAQPVLHVEVGTRTFTLPCFLAKDFPAWPRLLPTPTKVTYDTEQLSDALRYTSLAMGMDTTRAHLSGVWLSGTMVFATDGARLHMVEGLSRIKHDVLIGSTAVPALRGLLVEADTAPVLSYQLGSKSRSAWNLRLTGGCIATLITSMDDDMKPPPIDYLITQSKDGGVHFECDREALAEAFVFAGKLARGGAVCCTLNGHSKARVSAIDEDGGEITEEIPVNASGSGKLHVGINAQYMIEALSGLGERILVVTEAVPPLADSRTEHTDPIRIQGASDDSRIAIVMPMRMH